MSTTLQTLVPATFPLNGARLIEASAGTGKTYTIAALYVRLVLGHGTEATRFATHLSPQDILVMTFTRAATRELRERIRSRLAEAAQVFRGLETPKDDFLKGLLTDYQPDEGGRRAAAHRLALAADSMDSAAIFTIDAWCQRMLREHAFDSGSLFEETLVPDETELRHLATLDTWRQLCYPLPESQVAAVMDVWPSPEVFEKDMDRWMGKQLHAPEGDAPQALIARICGMRLAALQALRQQWAAWLPGLIEFISSQNPPKDHGWHGGKFKVDSLLKHLAALQTWTQASDDSLPAIQADAKIWTYLTPHGLTTLRSKGNETLPALPPGMDALGDLKTALDALPTLAEPLRPQVAWQAWQRLQTLKAQSASLGFGDMLRRLHDALHGPSGEALQQRIAQQFPVALIDEFQDTSPVQYEVFARVYAPDTNHPDRALFLIGDPKQSIYGFRGADIHSYLRARRATAGRHHALGTNHRSSQAMVDAVNGLFVQAETSRGQALGIPELPFTPVAANGKDERWVQAGQPLPALLVMVGQELTNTEQNRERYAVHCAEQVVTWLNDETVGFQATGPAKPASTNPAEPSAAPSLQPLQRLRLRDIAVLVRNSTEARAVQRALQTRGVVSVFLSDKASVFDTLEAQDLCHWLQGVAHPTDLLRVRTALATSVMGIALAQLPHELHDDVRLDQHLRHFARLHDVWKRQGVMAMLRLTLHLMGWAPRWLAEPGGERRLTNWLHLAELLQHATAELDGEHALIRWLHQRVQHPEDTQDGAVLRLESDADLLKIVTIHASKGLEYPVVLVPFASSFREAKPNSNAKGLEVLEVPDDTGERQLNWTPDADAWERADQARLREDIRLLYVALTRAKHALWLGFAAVKVGNGKACENQRSALGHLVSGGAALTPQGWWEAWETVAEKINAEAGLPVVRLLPEAALTTTQLVQPQTLPPLQDLPDYTADFERHWTIASYSRLTRDLSHTVSELPAVLPPARAPEALPGAVVDPDAQDTPTAPANLPIWHRFARGPSAGTFLHNQLEFLARDGFNPDPASNAMQRLAKRLCTSVYKQDAPALQTWFAHLLKTPLFDAAGHGPHVSLSELRNHQAELEYWLPLATLRTDEVDRLSQAHWHPQIARPKLQVSALQGMLMGFMDLVFEHEGRYWVLDYKSNQLAQGYRADALTQAMASHRYEVQAVLYTLALHRLLRWRLGPAYNPAQHLGGAVYWFIRGWDTPSHGVHVLPADLTWLDGIDAMLAPAAVGDLA